MGEITFSGFINETIYVLVTRLIQFLDIDVYSDIGLEGKNVANGVGDLQYFRLILLRG